MTMKKFWILCFLACCQTVKAGGYGAGDSCSVVTKSFWDNWFVQAGLGMSLQNPYGTNFKNVFPNGSTYGLNIGFGKWFTPEAGVRGGLNWQNGIIGNKHAYYLGSKEDPCNNYSKGGENNVNSFN